MEGRIKEENVTKAILKWLIDNQWEIICFDFPQSGTGKVLHPSTTTSKTDGAIIPDIIAFKNGIVVDFENKDRFVMDDFEKVSFLKSTTIYDKSLNTLLKGYSYTNIYYGIGMPFSDNNYSKAESNADMVDFIVYVKDENNILATGNNKRIFE